MRRQDEMVSTNPAIPQDASTVLLIRDAQAAGVEVLMVQRHQDIAFAGGMLVFPGGKVAEGDGDLPPERWMGPPLEDWCDTLKIEDRALALSLAVAAVRETFEEAGLLLAVREDGSRLTAADLREPQMIEARLRLNDRSRSWDWRPWLAAEGLVLDLGALRFWSWWITPRRSPKRYDTRFFLAHVPESQVAYRDGVEITGTRWWRPEEALEAHGRGEVRLMRPTRDNLHDLAAFSDANAAVNTAHGRVADRSRWLPRD